MEWRDEGLVVGVRKHGETSAILDLFTAERGRHAGLVQGGRSRRLRPLLQPGNSLVATWRARTEDQLGTFVVEPLRLRAGEMMGSATTLHALNHLCALLRLIPEREAHAGLHGAVELMLERIDEPRVFAVALVQFELQVLADLGFGLDLARCGATGRTDDLAFVSPRTGRAITREAGEPYRHRILPLPSILQAPGKSEGGVPPAEIRAAFRVTEHFLLRDLFGPRGLAVPRDRQAYLSAILPEE